MSPDGDGWNEWSRHVLAELKRLSDGMDRLEMRLSKIEAELSALRVKAGLWGAALGAIAGAVPAIVIYLIK